MSDYTKATVPLDRGGLYNVRLVSANSLVSANNAAGIESVVFDVTPTFSESLTADYDTITPIHMPGGIQVYKRTNSRKFSIGAHFVSRTSDKATLNMMALQLLRSWAMPYFGNNSSTRYKTTSETYAPITTTNSTGVASADMKTAAMTAEQVAAHNSRQNKGNVEMLGAPPALLYLYAYSLYQSDKGNDLLKGDIYNSGSKRDVSFGVNLSRIPVVLTSLDITYPEDVDYIPTYSNRKNASPEFGNRYYDNFSEPFPVKMDVSISLTETHSPREYERFSLQDFKSGRLTSF